MSHLRYTSKLYLRVICVVYLFAFVAFYVQIPGLYGDNGILPAKSLLENSKHKTLSAKVHYQPTLLWLAPYVGLDTNYALDVLALLGSFLAFTGMISQKFCTIPFFAGLWSLYFSLYQVGQVFVTTVLDDLLLEAGFLCLLVAPLLPRKNKAKSHPSINISMWLVRWLLFRYTFMSGITKLISGCPKWWDLTALSYHFQSMVLPSPLSWYSHHLPLWVLKLTAVYVQVCELALPFFYFIPIRSVRVTGFVFQIFLQICIVLTGNFNFTNVLVVALLISLLDDHFFFKMNSKKQWPAISDGINLVLHSALVYGIYRVYEFTLKDDVIDVKIAVTKEQFGLGLHYAILLGTAVGFLSLLATVLKCVMRLISDSSTMANKALSFTITAIYAVLAVALFTASIVPLQSLHKSTNSTMDPTLRTVYNRLHKLRTVSEYGLLFRKMTGVNGRPELILEGADSIEGPWKEYNFMYKPGNVNQSLPFVAPYSPRLDWQMWWAASSKIDKEPWVLSLAHRLLEGQKEVLNLMHAFGGDKPPKYIRGVLYTYKFSSWAQRDSPMWWTRVRESEYFPAYTKSTPALVDYLKARSLLPQTNTTGKQEVNIAWKLVLDRIRFLTGHLEGTLLSWSVFTAGCVIIRTSRIK